MRGGSNGNGKPSCCVAVLHWLLTGSTRPSRKAPKTPKAARPLVSSAGRPLENGWQKAGAYLGLLVLSVVLGFFLGALVWATFQASFFLARVLWEQVAAAFAGLGVPHASGAAALAICIAGGAAVGWWGMRFGGMPQPFMQVIASVRRAGRYDSAGMGASAMGVLLPQVFGGSVGLAAGLIGLVAAGCTFVGASLRCAGLRIMELGRRSAGAVCAALAHAPIEQTARRRKTAVESSAPGDAVEGTAITDPLSYDFRRWAKAVLYGAATVAGVGAFSLMTALFGTQVTLPRFAVPQVAGAQALWAVPCMVLGWAGTAVFYASSNACARMAPGLARHLVLMPLLGGAVLGTVAAFLPGVLYSGIAQTPALLSGEMRMGAAALIATGLCKFALTPWCIATGWKGGQIYPCVFAACACGLGFAALTGADPALCLAATASTSTACLLRSPAFAFMLLLLCFPAECAPLLACACIAGAALPVPHAQAAPASR